MVIRTIAWLIMNSALPVGLGPHGLGLIVLLVAGVVIAVVGVVGFVGVLPAVGLAEVLAAAPHNLAHAGVDLALFCHDLVKVGEEQGLAGVPQLLLGVVGDLVAAAVLESGVPRQSRGPAGQ